MGALGGSLGVPTHGTPYFFLFDCVQCVRASSSSRQRLCCVVAVTSTKTSPPSDLLELVTKLDANRFVRLRNEDEATKVAGDGEHPYFVVFASTAVRCGIFPRAACY